MSQANIRLVENLPATGRVMRRPTHHFSTKVRPWQIQPFMIAPVIPGETMKNLQLAARCVSKPVKNKLTGWWAEYYFFYVKHRDLPAAASAALQAMHVTNASTAALNAGATDRPYYTFGGGVDYVRLCLQRVVEEYFRSEEDGAWNSKLIDTLPIANINKTTGLESVRDAAAAAPPNDHELPGEISELPFGIPGSFASAYAMWEQMRALKITTASFEDYLRQFGQSLPEQTEDENRPELLRYIRDYTYPTSVVEPSTGVPTNAATWSIAERADKDRFFKEPGFIFGVQCFRPKIYYNAQKGSLAGALADAYSWLPAVATDQGWTTVKNFAFGAGPLQGVMGGGSYWLDVRDLFVFGDQFVNYAQTAADAVVALPDAAMQLRYASAADADALFTTPAGGGNVIESDGIVNLSILGRVVNQT